jgi:hypothetical protein
MLTAKKQITRTPLQTKWQQAPTQFRLYKNESKKEAAITACNERKH